MTPSRLIAGLALTLMITTAVLGSQIEIILPDGSRWRGDSDDRVKITVVERGIEREYEGFILATHDRYIEARVKIGSSMNKRPLMRSDIRKIETIAAGEGDADQQREAARDSDRDRQAKQDRDSDAPGVFVLPLEGPVGQFIRHEEIRKMGEKADEYGPGQIIILLLDTPGGAVIEMEQISRELFDLKRRHRVIAWVREAISAGCAIAFHCDEIYFMTEGSAGAMTAFAGDSSWQGEELRRWLRTAGEWAEAGGRSKYLAHAMIHHPMMVSYDKDPETGEVTFYNNLSGEYVLSDQRDNLVLTSSQAIHSNFAQGIADTEEDLAKLLDLPEWREKSDYGRRIASQWQQTVDRAQREIPRLAQRLNYEGTGSGDQLVVLQSQVRIIRELIAWWRRAPNVCFYMGVPPESELERMLDELRRQIRLLRERR